jgi:hypothetical protein
MACMGKFARLSFSDEIPEEGLELNEFLLKFIPLVLDDGSSHRRDHHEWLESGGRECSLWRIEGYGSPLCFLGVTGHSSRTPGAAARGINLMPARSSKE